MMNMNNFTAITHRIHWYTADAKYDCSSM